MTDNLDNVIEKLIKFRDERDWKQFHNPKDLAISLSIEASELLELFQWKKDKDIEKLVDSPSKSRFEEEIADVVVYAILLCDRLDIDLIDAINKKISKNGEKYPVLKSKGNSKKYTEL